MKDEIFKDIPIKKTMVETIQTDGEVIGAVLINNENKAERLVDLDNNMNPILTQQESNLLKQEANFGGEVLDPVEAHREAVKRNHAAQLDNEVKAQDPKARAKLSKPSEAPSMFSEKSALTEDRVEDIAEQVAERVIDEQMLNVEVTEEPKNNEDKS
jgi:hypothetical protein